MSNKLIVNLDILFMNDLVMSLILLWATAKYARLKPKIWSLLLSGIIGSLYTIILLFPMFKGFPGFLYNLSHVVLNLLVAILMIWVAFGKMKIQKFCKTLGYFYLITFLAGGTALSVYFILGSSPTKWVFGWIGIGEAYGWLYIVAAGLTVIIGRYSWQFIKERFHRERYHLVIRIWIEGQAVEVTGLVDTGNQLRDPLTRLPVIVVEFSALLLLFPPEIQQLFVEFKEADLIELAERLFESNWYKRFQIIPFSSLGNQGDMMIGCKADNLEILGEEPRQVGRVILALHRTELDLEGDYTALLHPEVLEVESF